MKVYFKKMVSGVIDIEKNDIEAAADVYYDMDTLTLLDNADWIETETIIVEEAEAE